MSNIPTLSTRTIKYFLVMTYYKLKNTLNDFENLEQKIIFNTVLFQAQIYFFFKAYRFLDSHLPQFKLGTLQKKISTSNFFHHCTFTDWDCMNYF